MKKIAVLFLVLILLLCSCQKSPQMSGSSSFSETVVSSSATDEEPLESEIEAKKEAKYVGKQSYSSVSPYITEIADDETSFYYIDCENLYSIDKQSKKRELLILGIGNFMYRQNNTLYTTHWEPEARILTFDLESKSPKLTIIPSDSAMKSDFTYGDWFFTKDWRVFDGYYDDEHKNRRYLADKNFKVKKELDIDGNIRFALENTVFYVGEDGDIYCYDFDKDEKYFVADFSPTNSDTRIFRENNLNYLGSDKILAHNGAEFEILSLADGSVFYKFPYKITDQNYTDAISTIYDDQNIYFIIKDGSERYKLDVLNLDTKQMRTIFCGEMDEKLLIPQLVLEDSEYLYLERAASLNASDADEGYYFRIKKDGTGREILFHKLSYDYYSIETPEFNNAVPKFDIWGIE